MTQFDKRNLSMMMDFYEMTMANGYFVDGRQDMEVVFDVFYRSNPDNGGFAIFAGLEQVIEYVENLRFLPKTLLSFFFFFFVKKKEKKERSKEKRETKNFNKLVF